MFFIGTAFLFALPLAAAPLLLHFFDRRRNVVIEWGAMQFLSEASAQRTSARKLKQWLLLLMRILAIVALILGLARTQLAGSWFGSRERGETILIIDNSMSMSRTVDGESLFSTSVAQAMDVLKETPDGDTIRLLQASPYPVWLQGNALRLTSSSLPVLQEQLQGLTPTQGRSDLLSALFTAAQAELDPACRHRRIVLVTDGQRADWTLTDETGWNRFQDVLRTAPVPMELIIVNAGESAPTPGNIAVDNIHASRTVVGLNQQFSLSAQIRNYSTTSSRPGSITWSVSDDQLDSSDIPALEGLQSHDVQWKYAFTETGVFAVTCRIDAEDDLEPDNSATVVVEVVDEIPVLLLEDSPDLAELQRDAFFVEAALGWDNGDRTGTDGVFVPRLASASAAERMDLQQFRAIVIPNVTVLSEELVRKLQDFVNTGGGLWLAAGPRTDIEAFNQFLFGDGDGLAPLALETIVEDSTTGTDAEGRAQHTTLDATVAASHPAMGELADGERLDTADVAVEQRFRFVPPPDGEEASVLMRVSNGEVLAVENYVGRGRVLVQAIPLRMQWSQLVRSQAFVVMVQDWLAYLTQPRATRHNLSPGDPITVHISEADSRDATLMTPHGDEIELTADAVGDGFVFRTSRTILPGNYVLELGAAGDRIPFHVSRDPEESNLNALSEAESLTLTRLADVAREAGNEENVASSQHDPIWQILFAGLIAMMTGELVLAGFISRERFGSDPIAETSQQAGSDITVASAAFRTAAPFSTDGDASKQSTATFARSFGSVSHKDIKSPQEVVEQQR
ncbi:MAG: BatA domain-containing protein [Planctomycetaceae bacterium]|nr:BatA domain-containing protein [Planctomycetaceae bacterium]